MMSLFETVSIFLVKLVFRLIFAGLLVFGLNNSAIAASGHVNFGGFVMPRGPAASISYPQTLVSFTDQVLLPVPANAKSATGLSVYSGTERLRTDFQILNIQGSNGAESWAVLVSLDNSPEQVFYLCQDGAGGCVHYKVIRTS